MDPAELEAKAEEATKNAFKELQERAQKAVKTRTFMADSLEKTAKRLKYLKQNADQEYSDNGYRQAYAIYMKLTVIVLEVLPKHKHYIRTSTPIVECRKIVMDALKMAEDLKKNELRKQFLCSFKADIQKKLKHAAQQAAPPVRAASPAATVTSSGPTDTDPHAVPTIRALDARLGVLRMRQAHREAGSAAGLVLGSTVTLTSLATLKPVAMANDGSVDGRGMAGPAGFPGTRFNVAPDNGFLRLENADNPGHYLSISRIGVGHNPGGDACELRIAPAGRGHAATGPEAPMTIAHAHGNGYFGMGPNGVPFLLPGIPTAADLRGHFKFAPTLPPQPQPSTLAYGSPHLPTPGASAAGFSAPPPQHAGVPGPIMTHQHDEGGRPSHEGSPGAAAGMPTPSLYPKSLPSIDSILELPTLTDLDSQHPTSLRPVHLPSKLIPTFLQMAASNNARNVETCGWLVGKLRNREFYITALLVPAQTGHADGCAPIDDMSKFNYCMENNCMELGWIHTHPSQTAFLSAVDLHTACGYQMMTKEAISIVCSAKYNENKIFGVTQPHGMDEVGNCTQTGHHPHSKTAFEEVRHVIYDPTATLEVKDWR